MSNLPVLLCTALVLCGGPAAAQQGAVDALVGGAAGSLESVREALALNDRTKDMLTYGVGVGVLGAALGLGLGAAVGGLGVSIEADPSGASVGVGALAVGGGLAAPSATQ